MERIGFAYRKHKVFGWKQCVQNHLTDKIFNFIYPDNCINNNAYNNLSFTRQISEVIGQKELNLRNVKPIMEVIAIVTMNVMMWIWVVNALLTFNTNEPHVCIKE